MFTPQLRSAAVQTQYDEDDANIFIGRQPIFDREKHLIAYELLYRNSFDNRADIIDDNLSTSDIIIKLLMKNKKSRLLRLFFCDRPGCQETAGCSSIEVLPTMTSTAFFSRRKTDSWV